MASTSRMYRGTYIRSRACHCSLLLLGNELCLFMCLFTTSERLWHPHHGRAGIPEGRLAGRRADTELLQDDSTHVDDRVPQEDATVAGQDEGQLCEDDHGQRCSPGEHYHTADLRACGH